MTLPHVFVLKLNILNTVINNLLQVFFRLWRNDVQVNRGAAQMTYSGYVVKNSRIVVTINMKRIYFQSIQLTNQFLQ